MDEVIVVGALVATGASMFNVVLRRVVGWTRAARRAAMWPLLLGEYSKANTESARIGVGLALSGIAFIAFGAFWQHNERTAACATLCTSRGYVVGRLSGGSMCLTHQEWRFIRQVAWTERAGFSVPEQFRELIIHSLTGVSHYVLRELAKGRVPKELRYVELTIPRLELPMNARELRALASVETIGIRTRREEISAAQLSHMLDALPNPANVRVFNLWGDLRAFQGEIEQRPWLRTLELISLQTAASSLSLELTATSMRLLRGGKVEPASWKGLTTALRAQGITTLPVFVAETDQTIDQSF